MIESRSEDPFPIAGHSDGVDVLFPDTPCEYGSDVGLVGEADALCFCAGTLIRTDRGEVAVEDLQVGDLAVTASGALRPIRSLGHRTVDGRGHRDPGEVMPVRISAGALGDNRPSRDLLVSPGHAICLDILGEVLIPAIALANGTIIRQEEADAVTYWHVALDSHDILIAEGQPSESHLDRGGGGGIVPLDDPPEGGAGARSHADPCREFYADGPVVEAVRGQIQARVGLLGWQLEESTWAGMHLVADGRRIDADTQDLSARFVVPASATDIWLVSETCRPADIGLGPDFRSLGVCVQDITADDGLNGKRAISLDDPRLSEGFHDCEDGMHRWTTGRARLPAELFEGYQGTVFLRVALARPALPHWVAPRQGGSQPQPDLAAA